MNPYLYDLVYAIWWYYEGLMWGESSFEEMDEDCRWMINTSRVIQERIGK